MSIQDIFLGATANDGTGEPLRDALRKLNANFGVLGTRTDVRELYIGWHSVAVPTATFQQIVDADLSTTVDPEGFWSTTNGRIEVPEGYSEILIVLNAGMPGASTGGWDYSAEIRKNTFISTGSTNEPSAWSDVQPTSLLAGSGNDVGSLVIRDACATGDTYGIHVRHDKGSSANSVGNMLAILIP